MRIASIEVRNFRCLRHVEIKFDEITTFVGPNSSGKSSILRALDWFFNGKKGDLTEDDIFSGSSKDDHKIQVRVTFNQLTHEDREKLGEKYAPPSVEEFSVWRTWDNGNEKITGKALAFPAFEAVRTANTASDKKKEWESLRADRPGLDLPRWTNRAEIEEAMDDWERSHPDALREAWVSDTHFFGFHGQGKLSGLFDYVFVTADLRASEESLDSRDTIIGRILERAIKREDADKELGILAEEFSIKQEMVNEKYLTPQLNQLANDLNIEISAFTSGRQVQLAAASSEPKAQPTRITVSIRDQRAETSVERQGHGFQRTLLISALKLLASRGQNITNASTICLAIEEPELFQHPTQAKVFATVLRNLAQDSRNGIQVAYATHSPYFIEPRSFDQVRRVHRQSNQSGQPETNIFHASMGNVCERLDGYTTNESIISRWNQVCMKNLAEAFFAEAVVLVEGDDDKAILEGIAARTRQFALDGIAVAATNGKEHIYIPHAILRELGIPVFVVFDNDSQLRLRMEKKKKSEKDIHDAEASTRKINRTLLRYLNLNEEECPQGVFSRIAAAVPDTLESAIDLYWSGWKSKRDEIVKEGRGSRGKNSATYALTAEECESEPTGILVDIVREARLLASDR